MLDFGINTRIRHFIDVNSIGKRIKLSIAIEHLIRDVTEAKQAKALFFHS